jgi:uncharacterized protein YjiK
MRDNYSYNKLISYALVIATFISFFPVGRISTTLAQGNSVILRQVQVLDVDPAELHNPAGLAFSHRANAFQVIQARTPGQPTPSVTDSIKLTPFARPDGSAQIAAIIQDPINVAFDDKGQRLLLLHAAANQLLEVHENSDGNLEAGSLNRYDAKPFGLQNPQGLAVDPASGTLFVLDAVGPRLVRITPASDGSFTNASLSAIPLGLSEVRGLAFDPSTNHFHVVSPAEQVLYELTQAGEVVASRDLSPFHVGNSQGILFAPTTDQTDNASKSSLFLADQGSRQSSGQIVEFSLSAATASAAPSFTSSLVKTTDMANTATFSPPSPDPSGLTYLPNSNTLLMVDGEVEETVSGITHFQGANVWQMTLGGSVARTANISRVAPTVVPMTNEPTGVTWNPSNGTYFVTDDSDLRVYSLNPGADGLIGTSDDSWTYFSTVANGNNNGDPEGIAFNTWSNHLFVSDGVNMEIYEYTTTGTLVNHFDVASYGVLDNESVEFNPDSGTLLVLSNHSSPIIVETTTSGGLLRTIDVSAANAFAPAGLAYAPASDGSAAKHYYIVDRAVDNNDNPNIIDGKMFELTAPVSGTPGNMPPMANAGPDQTISLPANALLDGTVSDDGLPNPPGILTTTWSQVSGPGSVIFGNPNAVDTTASFSAVGAYILRLTTSDGQLSSSDDVTITVTGSGATTIAEVRVMASSDDAEESATGSVSLTSTDLELVYDGSNQTVGMRFNGVAVPQGAQILNAYVQFKVDEVNSEATSLTIRGQATDNAPTFVASNQNISSRPRTTASVAWSPVPWTTVNEVGPNEQTPSLVAVIQEIVNRPGWAGGNSLAIIITGSGHRTARAYDGETTGAPLLHVEYGTLTSTSTATRTPLLTNTPTSTPTATFTPTATSTPIATFTSTATTAPLPDLIFADSFESGNLSAWSSSANAGSLSVSAAAALKGTRGLQVSITSNTSTYINDTTPNAEPRYRARFYFDPNSIAMTTNNAHYIFYGFDPAGTVAVRVELRTSSGQYQIRVGVLNDSTTFTSTAWFTISDAPHPIEIDWQASTAVGANNGGVTLWIDGIQKANLTGVDNDTRRIDRIRLGGASGIDSGTRGTEYFDAFESRRQTYIGP